MCLQMFEKKGISGDRIELYGLLQKKKDHLSFYSKIDIGLDPFPYNGTTTTFEALWMGIPVITLEGDRHAARVGTSIMTHLNLPQFIADTKENYIKKAVELAGDSKRLAVYRKELRSILKSSKSCDEHHFAKKIETAFREMWRTWCQSDLVFPVTVPGEDESPLESTTFPKLLSPANDAVELNIRGEELFAQGKLQEAEEIFEKALRENPHLAVIHNNLGVLQWQMGNAHTALNHLKKALGLEPENCETLANIEAVFQQMKETPRRETDLPVVRILHQMARSGGTVLSKCIGCMQDIVLLSEIHPQGTKWINLLDQACHWFGLVETGELETLTNKISFIDAVSLIEEKCREQGKNLVIRDWSHLDFTAVPYVARPSYRLSLAESLADRFRLIQIATVRHPIDQWLSLRRLSIMQGKIDLEMFLTGYRKFAEQCQETGFIRYEDFVQSPEEKIEKLCQDLQISYDPDFINKWWPYSTITGDTNSERGSKKEIRLVPRRAIDSDTLNRFHENDDYHTSLELLGYHICHDVL